MKGISLLEYYAGEGFRMHGKTLPSEARDTFAYTLRQPLGAVGLIAPWNFPWAIPVWKSAPALVAGNCVVFKPSELVPATAALLTEIYEEAGLPPGVFNMVVGEGAEVGRGDGRGARAAGDLVHRVEPRRPGAVREGGAARRQGHLRDGRQERGDRHARRRPRQGGDGDPRRRIRLHRAALHGDLAGDRPSRREAGAGRSAGRLGGADQGRPRARRDDGDGPVDRRRAVVHRARLHRDRPEGGRPAAHRRPASRPPVAGLVHRPDHLRRRRPGDAHLPGRDLRPGALGGRGRRISRTRWPRPTPSSTG